MSTDLANSIVEVTGDQEIGTGFVLGNNLIVTCAHVVGRPDYHPSFVFHREGEKERQAAILSELWSPKEVHDIAVLQFGGGLPEGVLPLKLGHSTGTQGHPCRAIGYPDLEPIVGVPGQGTIVDHVRASGGRKLIQVSSKEITDGFSGAPLLDEDTDRIVGMIIWVANKLPETAYALPAETLLKHLGARWPELRLHPDRALAEYFEAVASRNENLPLAYGRRDRRKLSQIYVERHLSLIASADTRRRASTPTEHPIRLEKRRVLPQTDPVRRRQIERLSGFYMECFIPSVNIAHGINSIIE